MLQPASHQARRSSSAMRCLIVLTLFALLQVLMTGVQGAEVTVTSGGDCTVSGATCETKSTCDTTAKACKWNVGEPCVVATPKCGPNAVCDSTTTMCKCSDGYTGTPTCIADGQLNGVCKASSVCDAANTQCTNSKCVCKTGYTEASGQCIADGQLNGACKASSVCDAANTQCTGSKCVCKTGYTEVSGQCSGAVNVIASLALILVSVATSRFL